MNGSAFDEMGALRSLTAADLPPAQVEAIGCRCRAELARCANRRARTMRRVLGGLELTAALAVGVLYLVWGLTCASRVFADSRLSPGSVRPGAAAVAAAGRAPMLGQEMRARPCGRCAMDCIGQESGIHSEIVDRV